MPGKAASLAKSFGRPDAVPRAMERRLRDGSNSHTGVAKNTPIVDADPLCQPRYRTPRAFRIELAEGHAATRWPSHPRVATCRS
jgi:hypothetical protein